MKQKINLRLIGMSIAVVIVTVVSMTFVFYGLFQKQVQSDLRLNAALLKSTGVFEKEYAEDEIGSGLSAWLESGSDNTEGLRVTWIDTDGTVLYDNDTDASLLENHAERPEFQDAVSTGEGETVRRSDTMNTNTFYYAVRLEDGSVLRLAEDVRSMLSMFLTVIPLLILIVAVLIVASVIIGRLLTRQLLAPIERIAQNLEETPTEPVYKELVPFVNTIREQHDNILSAAKARQDFTANVSHELKTPLTAISGYAELMENHMADPEQTARFAKEIRQNADRLLSLIDDIIRLSELDSGGHDLPAFEQTDLFAVVQACAELLQVSAEKQKVYLTVEGEPCPVRGNRRMLSELVENLCQNAIRYNNEGGQVRISVHTEKERPVLTVADTGIGIPRDLQDRVFERFFRVDKSRSKESGGTGLGLAIVKHIVELHDAEIFLESDVEKGTTIRVVF